MKNNIACKMMVLLMAVTMLAIYISSVHASITPENLYDINTVHSLYIVMSPEDFDAMRFSTDDESGHVYAEEVEPGVFEHTYWQAYMAENQAMTDSISIAIRRKSDPAAPDEGDPQKFSLKIDISRPGFTPQGQRFGGKKKLSLESSAVINEGLAWSIYNAAGVISGRCNWVKVFMSTDWGANFTYRGLYANVEQPDEEFLEDHMPGRHDYGFLYKITEYNGEEKRTRELETNPFEFSWYPFDHPTYMTEEPIPADWLTKAQQFVDMDQLLKFAAVENFIVNQDGTVNKGNNYWYYDWATNPQDPNIMDPAYRQPRMYFPWDLDASLQVDGETFPVITESIPGRLGHFTKGLILEKNESGTPYGYETFRSQYLGMYASIINGPLTKPKLLSLVSTIETAIAAEVDADPYIAGTSSKFDSLRAYVQDRWDFVASELDSATQIYRVSGYIKKINNTPVKDVLVTPETDGGFGITNSNGYFEVWVSDGWSGNITPTKKDYTFTPPYTIYTQVTADQSGDFLANLDADIDGSGDVGLPDLLALCENWLNPADLSTGDLDGSGDIDLLDVVEISEYWLE